MVIEAKHFEFLFETNIAKSHSIIVRHEVRVIT